MTSIEFQPSSKAILLEDDKAGLRSTIGLGHGDKVHVDDKANGEHSVLAKLIDQVRPIQCTWRMP